MTRSGSQNILHLALPYADYVSVLSGGALPAQASAILDKGLATFGRVLVYGANKATGALLRAQLGKRFVTFINTDTLCPEMALDFDCVVIATGPEHYPAIVKTLADMLPGKTFAVVTLFDRQAIAPAADQSEYDRRLLTRPSGVILELANYCNSRCIFCPLFQGGFTLNRALRPRQLMGMELYEKILAEISGWGADLKNFNLRGHGEPLLAPDFVQRMELLKQYGVADRTMLFTNAALLDEKAARAVVDAGVDAVTVAFDGYTKEVYEAHRVGCNFETVRANIERLAKIRDASCGTTKIRVINVVTHLNMHQVFQSYLHWRGVLNPGLDSFHCSPSKSWARQDLEDSAITVEKTDFSCEPGVCAQAFTHLFILSDGRVPCCCWDYNFDVLGRALGNAADQSLLEIWQGQPYADFRSAFLAPGHKGVPGRCLNCSILYERRYIPISCDTEA